jgi:hypothetical protein
MKKIVYLTSFFFIVIVFSFRLVTSAQETGVRGDYDRYAVLFKAGKEPDFSTNTSWRGMYVRNDWKRYADGTEFKDPLPEAQVLMGIYLLATVDRALNYEIQNIVLEKGLLSATLSETIVLDQIAVWMEKDPIFSGTATKTTAEGEENSFYAEGELVGDFRVSRFEMERLMRKRMTSGVPHSARTESIAILQLFSPEIAGGWGAQYRVIREKISALDTLADSFAFHWSKERKEEELQRLMDDAGVQKKAEQRVRLEIETRSENMIAEEVQEIKGRHLQAVAKEELEKIVAKHTAHKYLIGIYKGMDYHKRDLEKIYHHYLGAANQGNPIAQYHLALFLVYFGDILDMKKEDVQQGSESWLEKAYSSDLTRERVVALKTQLLTESEKIEKRKEDTGRKIETLIRLEHERIDMIDNVLIQVAKRVRIINEVQKRMLQEMERERERRAQTEREFFRAAAMAEAARLESRRPIITIRTR